MRHVSRAWLKSMPLTSHKRHMSDHNLPSPPNSLQACSQHTISLHPVGLRTTSTTHNSPFQMTCGEHLKQSPVHSTNSFKKGLVFSSVNEHAKKMDDITNVPLESLPSRPWSTVFHLFKKSVHANTSIQKTTPHHRTATKQHITDKSPDRHRTFTSAHRNCNNSF